MPTAAEIGPAGSDRNSPASDAPPTVRSKRSDEERDGEMNAAASGEMESSPNGFTGTQPNTIVTQTTWPAEFVVVFRPSAMRDCDMVFCTFSSVRERWYWPNTSQCQV